MQVFEILHVRLKGLVSISFPYFHNGRELTNVLNISQKCDVYSIPDISRATRDFLRKIFLFVEKGFRLFDQKLSGIFNALNANICTKVLLFARARKCSRDFYRDS